MTEYEIYDTYAEIKNSIKSDYVFLSHFDQETSKQILPIFISPMPNNYYNIVFYAKGLDQLPQYSLALPEFAPIIS